MVQVEERQINAEVASLTVSTTTAARGGVLIDISTADEPPEDCPAPASATSPKLGVLFSKTCSKGPTESEERHRGEGQKCPTC